MDFRRGSHNLGPRGIALFSIIGSRFSLDSRILLSTVVLGLPALSGGVIKFCLRNVSTRRAYDTLWERYRISIAMTASGDSEGLRLSPHIYHSADQIDRVVAAVCA